MLNLDWRHGRSVAPVTSSPAPDPTATFAWYMAALLVGRQLRTCIRHCTSNLGQLAPALLAIARETLDQGRFTAAACR